MNKYNFSENPKQTVREIVDNYKIYRKKLLKAGYNVERMEIEDSMAEEMDELKRIVLSYVTMNDTELESFIDKSIEDINWIIENEINKGA